MAGEAPLTLVGNLTADPELRNTGVAMVSFTIAQTPRVFDRATNTYRDGEPLFMRCVAFRELADHVAATLSKGARVIATGLLKQRSYQDREGNGRTVIELQVDAIGPDLRYATATIHRAAAPGSSQRSSTDWGAVNAPAARESGVTEDWLTAPIGTPSVQTDDVPF